MNHRRFFRLISVFLILCVAGSASAQYYSPYNAPQRGYERDDREYYRPRHEERRYEERRYERDYGYERQRRDLGQVCVTGRGSCGSAPNYVGAPCRCNIPGFGRKRGNIER